MSKILLVAGDGIGPEIMEQAKRILACFKNELPVTLVEKRIGGAAIDADGTPFPPDTEQEAKTADAVLLGASAAPNGMRSPSRNAPKKASSASAKHWAFMPICAPSLCGRN